jgi:hypothetical protein
MSESTRLKIGDVVLALIPDRPDREVVVEEAYRGFAADDPPDANLHV